MLARFLDLFLDRLELLLGLLDPILRLANAFAKLVLLHSGAIVLAGTAENPE